VNHKANLVGIVGYGRAGKDTVAGFMPGYQRLAFADKVREVCDKLDPYVWLRSHHSLRRLSEYRRINNDDGWLKARTTYRDELVRIGAGFREVFGKDFWVEQVARQIDAKHSLLPIVITDVRYSNEVEMIGERGGKLWYVHRPGYGPTNGEEARSIGEILDIYGASLVDVPNTGSLDDLRRVVQQLLSTEQ
jgi:hypothetical protein